jgi:hypothetical protein
MNRSRTAQPHIQAVRTEPFHNASRSPDLQRTPCGHTSIPPSKS